ncbi:MAG: acyl-CoA thioesterase [Candidatus Anaerobiospirillum pullicola]|uniref:Acyl-CoA thioesterase n=1 Tax=Candidatus Anaerobiospirillum pullicola TaxID=2838451 RepID=A0A948THS5_9GAMM|nr:acyl-CoA thioesterase [Candidatus Anaerobiospirillum pullicola]
MAKTKLLLTCVDYTIPFHDNDMAGIVWHGNYFKYFEFARDQLLARLDLSIVTLAHEHHVGLPVIKSFCRYRKMLTFQEPIKIYAAISDYENYLRFDFEIKDRNGTTMTTGYTQHAAIDLNTNELLFTLPDLIKERIAQHLDSQVKH